MGLSESAQRVRGQCCVTSLLPDVLPSSCLYVGGPYSSSVIIVFAEQRYAGAVYDVVVCPSVRHTPVLYQNG